MDVPHCPNCTALSLQVEQLRAELGALQTKLAAAKKDSSNSSKPPSSDIVKPKGSSGPQAKKKGKRGGQEGHSRHQRPPFEAKDIDETIDYTLEGCPDCGGDLEPGSAEPRVVQQVKIIIKPVVNAHRGLPYWCRQCQKTHYGRIDPQVKKAGLLDPGLTTLVGYLKGACHNSFSTIRKFLHDVVGLTVSRGYLVKVIAKVSDSLQDPYTSLLDLLPQQAVLNTDETGHKSNGQALWTWCFRAPLFTLFKIAPSRGSDVLIDVLGREFNGVLGCDYFSAYRKYMRECGVLVQFCLAHLIRDLKFLAEHPEGRTRAYGQRVLDKVRALFAVIHTRERRHPAAFQVALENAGDELCAEALWRVPATKEAQNLARRFEKHGESYLRFITTPGIEPTNNLAEQAIRFVVLDRQVTQGTRGEVGQRWSERIWTVLATCAQQGKRAYTFLRDAVAAFFQNQPAPSLVPDSS